MASPSGLGKAEQQFVLTSLTTQSPFSSPFPSKRSFGISLAMEQFAGPSTEAVAPQIRERSSIWEGLRDQITQLHSVQGKPLIEVMSIIEREHGFVASQRQYKIKISEWRVGKNIKVDEYKFMVQTQANRAQENKDTHFRVRGRDVAPEKIERAVKRQKLSDQELIAMPSIPTPSDISYGTPSAVDPQSPYVQQAVTPSPGPIFATSFNQGPIHSSSNISEWQNHAFLVSPGYLPATPLPVVWHNSSTPLPSASFQSPPGMLQSSGSLWSTGPMDGIIEEGYVADLTSDSGACDTKYERLIELVRKTEKSELPNYMEMMSEVNSLVYDLIASDHQKSQAVVPEDSASTPPCYVCRALDVIGTDVVAAEVESERILLEAIAISEGCFGEEHLGALHFRVKLFLLYSKLGYRTGECRGVLLQILLVASRKAPSLQAHELASILLDLPDGAEQTKCLWLQIASWGSSLGISSHQLSKLSIRDDTFRDSPRKIWEMISAAMDRTSATIYKIEDTSTLALSFEIILQQGSETVDGSSYFWMAIFLLVLHDSWRIIYNSKTLLTKAVSSHLPASNSIKSGLQRWNALYRFVPTVNGADSTTDSGSSITRQQSNSDNISETRKPIESLVDLHLELAEFSLCRLEKLDDSNAFSKVLRASRAAIIQYFLCKAVRYGHSSLITKLEEHFRDAIFDNASWTDLLNLDGTVSRWAIDSPLHLAIQKGHFLTVEALLNAGADPDGPPVWDGRKKKPLELAADFGHDGIVRLLIKRGADVSNTSVWVMKSTVRSSDQHLDDSILDSFIGSRNMLSKLYYLILVGKFERYERLDVVSAEIKDDLAIARRHGPKSEGPLLRATLDPYERNVLLGFLDEEDHSGRGLELILHVITDIQIEQQGRSILKSALFDTDAVDEMLKPTETSDSPVLHTLVARNAPNALSVFLGLRPNLAAVDSEGNTALHIAARLNRVACAKLLLTCKIDVDLENNNGDTALQIALKKEHKKILDEILMVLPMNLVVEEGD